MQDSCRKKCVLVTGGAGFLGSHLCERLLELDCNVLCLDNFFTGTKSNIVHLLPNPRFEMLRHDICYPIDLQIDEIYNLACPASPKHYQLDPVQTIKTCIYGSIHVLDLAKKLNIKILQASTSEIYGDPTEHPQKETYWGNVNPIGIRSCYDEGKRAAETLFFDYHRQYGVDVRVVRIFNTYGPRMQFDDGRVISNFIIQAITNQPITIYGTGLQTRSFCYVDDLISGMIAFMNCSIEKIGPLNLGNPMEFNMQELAEKILKITGSSSRIVYEKLPQDDPQKRQPDISKARDYLGWEPQMSLEEGLKKTVENFKSRLKVDSSI